MNVPISEKIIKILKSAGALSEQGLIKRAGVPKRHLVRFRRDLNRLIESGQVEELAGRYTLAAGKLLKGEVVAIHARFGFVRLEEGGELFIPGKYLMDSLPGDKVSLKKMSRPGERESGVIRRVDSRANRRYSAILLEDEGMLLAQPLGAIRFPLPVAKGADVKAGERVVIEPKFSRDQELLAKVLYVAGSSESAEAAAEAFIVANGIEREFPEEAASEAESASKRPALKEGRLDLRSREIFTIDGADARDLDDAVSLWREDGRLVLGVHIADVSEYVRHGGELDKAALLRGTSVYFGGGVVPMLPVTLSNGACSLGGGEDKLTLSCFMSFSEEGEMGEVSLYKSIINSRCRGVYEEINALLAGAATAKVQKKYEGLCETLNTMVKLAAVLLKNRRMNGSVELSSVECKIEVGENGEAKNIAKREPGLSESMIEEFMLACNRAVAGVLEERGLPALWRVHEPPGEEKCEELFSVLELLGVSAKRPTGRLSSAMLKDILKLCENKPYEAAINMLALRTMSKARYSSENTGHYGLNFKTYLHFTSPIRRYPDLVVHRIVKAFIKSAGDGTGFRAGEGNAAAVSIPPRYKKGLPEIAKQSTAREILAATAERECNGYYIAEAMRDRVGEVFMGVVSGAAVGGLYVLLENGAEGLIREGLLSERGFFYSSAIYFTGGGGKKIMVGEILKVRLSSVSVQLGKLYLELYNDESDS